MWMGNLENIFRVSGQVGSCAMEHSFYFGVPETWGNTYQARSHSTLKKRRAVPFGPTELVAAESHCQAAPSESRRLPVGPVN